MDSNLSAAVAELLEQTYIEPWEILDDMDEEVLNMIGNVQGSFTEDQLTNLAVQLLNKDPEVRSVLGHHIRDALVTILNYQDFSTRTLESGVF